MSETEILQHKSFVAGSIMQSVAALESEVWSLVNHGPGHHLGGNDLDKEGKRVLSIVAESLEKETIVKRCDLMLQLIRGKKLDVGKQPMQDLSLLIRLRNEITHFKSLWTTEMDSRTLFDALKAKDANPPSFYAGLGMNFFPHICLNFSRAKWAVDTVVTFIEYYYEELDIKSPLDGHDRYLISL